MVIKDESKYFYAETQAEWRKWLEENHEKEDYIWLVIYKKSSNIPSIYYPEALDEALCFGWIDSIKYKKDDDSAIQYFSKRKPKSNWSKVNKEKVARLISEGKMHESGMKMVNLAKEKGTWEALEEVENLILPNDLQEAFENYPVAFSNWENFSKSNKRGILEVLLNAKKEETRNKRIVEIVTKADENKVAFFEKWQKKSKNSVI